MDADQPGLFDAPASPAPVKGPPRGRKGERCLRTVTAHVTITDAGALQEAVRRAQEEGLVVDLGPIEANDAEDLDDSLPEDGLDAVAWLVWPTEGMDALLESDAVRLEGVEIEVADDPSGRGVLTWSATVKLRNVPEMRRIAAEAHPDEVADIESSLEAAWRCAADPYEPIRSVPGITWTPGTVVVRHLPARPTRHG